MKTSFDGYNYIIRLERGELLVESITAFAKEKQIKGAWINGLGGAQWVEVGFYDLNKKHYTWKRFDELLEITSLQGNIAWKDSEPALHLHGTLGRSDFTTIGGHIKELQVGGTCELHLHAIFNDVLARSPDDATGLSLLDL